MTFSILARCARTGQLAAAVATDLMASGSRVAHCAAGVGGVLTQHRTDPRLGPRGLALLRSGCSAPETLEALVASTAHASWRQLAVLDVHGETAAWSGARVKPEMAFASTTDAVALGHLLVSAGVPGAMLHSFQTTTMALPLAERLLRALEAGEQAGGGLRPLQSAHLLVVDVHSFPLVDLRTDWHDAPVSELRALWTRFAPMMADFVLRAVQPEDAPIL